MRLKKIIAVTAVLALLSGCGKTTSTDAPAGSEETGAETSVTTAAPEESSSPQETPVTSETGEGSPEVVSPDDEEAMKDSIRSLFGHKTNAQREWEEYQSTYTYTTTDMEEYLEDLADTFTLTLDSTGLVTRTHAPTTGSLQWVIVVNGITQLQRNAEGEMSYRPMNYGAGDYQVWLESYGAGGYQRVSNIVEWRSPDFFDEQEDSQSQEEEVFGFERERVVTKKGHMKHIARTVYTHDYPVEYKKGFVIDPDHDGYCNGCIFFAGKDENGKEIQYISDNDSSTIHISSLDQEGDSTLYIWCDSVTEKDYIVSVKDEGNGKYTALDCCTGEVIYTRDGDSLTLFGEKADLSRTEGEGWFLFSSSDPHDSDHFYVSIKGEAHEETA